MQIILNIKKENQFELKKKTVFKKFTDRFKMEINEKKIHTESAISFLNDFRLAVVRIPGDIGFRVKRNPKNINSKLDQYATKYIHSTVLLARSKWFLKTYPIFKQNEETNIFEDRNQALDDINVKITPTFDDNDVLVLQIDGVSLDSFQEFS